MINIAVVDHLQQLFMKSAKSEEIFLENRGITVEELALELDSSVGSAFGIIKSLQYCKVCVKRVPGTKEVELVTK